MPPLQLRDQFPTLKAFKEALHAWAIEAHFEPRILKSDTGRVRVGCKRDPNCPFVIRCNWERKNGKEPVARVTVLRDRHTCLNGIEWTAAQLQGAMGHEMNGVGNAMNGGMNGVNNGLGMNGMGGPPQVEIRQDGEGNIVGGARVLGPRNPGDVSGPPIVPVLPKVQRNSASRLPFLMEILPRLMNIQKETTPIEIRECLLREYGAEVHLQQCRRAKTEILKKRRVGAGGEGENAQQGNQEVQDPSRQAQSVDGMGDSESANEASQQLFGDINANGTGATQNQQQSPHAFALHTATGVVAPVVPDRGAAALRAVGETPIKCPYCINLRWMKSIQDAVEHMSMHVTV
ncbi:Uncharacterized protein BP5553_04147 [Venustampulla echinocandica]|uniref:Transposase MuDR plant domain-containing protein n=1 Tax=Venustampulla echinocandica TaxID=2656787 RepID=A0A370TWB6_9HELO|nr:Uncharacterized protein BP5553_04147 [Venustampulla echinocandica]RDL39807.1 Uncharacterized protein BP5553_04147 [Venustampulla echinocandica]